VATPSWARCADRATSWTSSRAARACPYVSVPAVFSLSSGCAVSSTAVHPSGPALGAGHTFGSRRSGMGRPAGHLGKCGAWGTAAGRIPPLVGRGGTVHSRSGAVAHACPGLVKAMRKPRQSPRAGPGEASTEPPVSTPSPPDHLSYPEQMPRNVRSTRGMTMPGDGDPGHERVFVRCELSPGEDLFGPVVPPGPGHHDGRASRELLPRAERHGARRDPGAGPRGCEPGGECRGVRSRHRARFRVRSHQVPDP
jgi:hypothetical protein